MRASFLERFSVNEFLAHDGEEDSAVGQIWEGPISEQLAEKRHPCIQAVLLKNFKNDELSFVDFPVRPWVKKAAHRSMFVGVKTAECLVPLTTIQLGENRLHMSGLECVERGVRNLSQVVPLNDVCHEMGLGITKGSSHLRCEGLLASEEAFEFEPKAIGWRFEEASLKRGRFRYLFDLG